MSRNINYKETVEKKIENENKTKKLIKTKINKTNEIDETNKIDEINKTNEIDEINERNNKIYKVSQINESEKITCICGSNIKKSGQKAHEQSKKHVNFILLEENKNKKKWMKKICYKSNIFTYDCIPYFF